MNRRNGFRVMANLIELVKPLTGFMILAILMGVMGHLCAAFLTILGGYAVLELLQFDTPFTLAVIFSCLVAFALLRGILHYGEQACNHYIAFKLLALLRNNVFEALRKLCPAKLEGREKGDLISVITSDIELLEVFYAHTISPGAIAFFMTIFMCLFTGGFHPALGLLALAAYLIVGVIIPLIASKASGDNGISVRSKSGDLSGFVLDSLRGLLETIQYGQGKERLHEMNHKNEELSQYEERMKKATGRNMAVTNHSILLFDIVMLFVSVLLYQKGKVGAEGVLIPVIAFMSSFGPVSALAYLGSGLQNTFAAGNRVLDILEEIPVTEEVSGKPALTFEGAAVRNVTFSYGEEEILSNVSAAFPQHDIVGIVGQSGSGKSTLLKLLMRFWNVGKGDILFSDTPVNEINTDNLRNMESFVTQETHLFHDSIANNLRIAKLDATKEELRTACKKASIHDFILTLPKGYDTLAGELGDTLSGGQRQRLGLARAFLHNAPFMLLDEPTSNLDSLNEGIILKSLKREREGKTILLVSHRQSTMRIADTVYSVEHGRMS